MSSVILHRQTLLMAVAMFSCVLFASGQTGTKQVLGLDSTKGEVTFVSRTNFSAITVKGKSEELHVEVRTAPSADGLTIVEAKAIVPVRTLETGMGLRDEHMRSKIFAAGSEVPDVRFEVKDAHCPRSAEQFRCAVDGTLSIRNQPKPARFELTIREMKPGSSYRVSGNGTVKLSTYAIERPSQLGVKVEDTVEVQLRFTVEAKESASRGGRP